MFNCAKVSPLEPLDGKDEIKHDCQGSDSYMFVVHLFKLVPYGSCLLPLKNTDKTNLVSTQFLSTLMIGFH